MKVVTRINQVTKTRNCYTILCDDGIITILDKIGLCHLCERMVGTKYVNAGCALKAIQRRLNDRMEWYIRGEYAHNSSGGKVLLDEWELEGCIFE